MKMLALNKVADKPNLQVFRGEMRQAGLVD
jgi:hypothetical protein